MLKYRAVETDGIFHVIQAGLIWCQGYIPEKRHANWNHATRTQNSNL